MERKDLRQKEKGPRNDISEALLIGLAARESHFPESQSRLFWSQMRRFGEQFSIA
jgi:hypothetical protein